MLSGTKDKFDIIAVLDTSERVGQKLFGQIRDLFALLSSQFDLSPSQSRMSVVSFSNVPTTILNLGQGTDQKAVNAVLSSLSMEPGKPDLNSALQSVIRILADRIEPSRRTVPTKVVVYSSGISKDAMKAAAGSFEEINKRNAGIIMLIVDDSEQRKEDAISALPRTAVTVSSSTTGLFGEPFSLLVDRVSETTGMFKTVKLAVTNIILIFHQP